METDYDLVERNIISKKDKEFCLEKIGTKLGAPLECVGRVYDVTVRRVYSDPASKKSIFTANGLYLWVNRSGSLREMTETNIVNFPRFARYLVLHDSKNDRTVLLYGVKVSNMPYEGSDFVYGVKVSNMPYEGSDFVRNDSIVVEANLSVPMDDIFEAMRFIKGDILGKMYIDEYDELLNAPDETPVVNKSLTKNKK